MHCNSSPKIQLHELGNRIPVPCFLICTVQFKKIVSNERIIYVK